MSDIYFKLNKLYRSYYNLLNKIEDDSNKKNIYPSSETINKWGFLPPKLLSYKKDYLSIKEQDVQVNNLNIKCESENFVNNNSKFRICTFNVHNWVSVCPNDNLYKKSLSPFIEFFKKINCDILCLQEVVPLYKNHLNEDIDDYSEISKCNFSYIVDEFKKIGYEYSFISNTNLSSYQRSKNQSEYFYLANAIFSKINFDYEKSFLLPTNRNFICVKIMIDNIPILIYNTHLEFVRRGVVNYLKHKLNPKGPENNVYNLQINLLLLDILINCKKHNTKNVIVCGDFNKPYYEIDSIEEIRWIYEDIKNNFYYFNKFFKDTSKDRNKITNLTQENQTDFIFTTKNLLEHFFITNHQILKSDLSDHYPIICDFSL